MPTSSELIIRSNDKGTDVPPPEDYDECLVNSNLPCDELPITLITPPILEDYVHDLTLPCDHVSTILSAPIQLTVDQKEPCESGNKTTCCPQGERAQGAHSKS